MAALTGCSMDKVASNMSMDLQKVEINNIGQEDFDAVLNVRITNRNWFGVDVSDLKYEAYVDDTLLGYGRIDQEIEVPGDDEIIAKLPVKGTYCRLLNRMYDLLRGRFGYRVNGEVEYEVLFMDKRLKFNTEKTAENPMDIIKGGTVN